MFEEARLAYARLREFDQRATPEVVTAWIDNGRRCFPESFNDVVTWRYPHADDPWHTAFTTGMRVERVVVDGETIVDKGTTTRVDEHEIRVKARESAARLHRRMEDAKV